MKQDLRGKHIQVVGLGKSGQGAALLGKARGARVSATDRNKKIEFDLTLIENAGVEIYLGVENLIPDVGLVIVSPGVGPDNNIIKEAENKKIPVIGEMEFAFEVCKVPIIGITGTDGKSSVVTMVEACLKAAGIPAWAGGNLGEPLSALVIDQEKMKFLKWIVLEISSYNLERINTFQPKISCILNLARIICLDIKT